MNKEPTKLRDLIQADDEVAVEATGGTFTIQEGIDDSKVVTEPIRFDATIEETQAAVDKARLSALEHEVAEAAIAVRKYQTGPTPTDNTHQEWWDEYQRIFSIRTEAEDALIKFKEEL